MKQVFTFFALLFICVADINASSINGGQIDYVNMGNQKYAVTVTIFKNCSGSIGTTTVLTSKCSTGLQFDTLKHISATDVTDLGKDCNIKSLCAGGSKVFPYGLEKHVYYAVVTLGSLTCCEVTFSWQQCCRLSSITTTQASTNFYIEAMVNKCNNINLKWTSFNQPFLIPLGQNINLNFSAADSVDSDSISYALVTAQSASGTGIAYLSSHSPQNPVTYLGFPNTAAPSPAGLRFDEKRGNLSFRPTKSGEVANIVVEATEWRLISGTMTAIGKIQRDATVIVYSSSTYPTNNTPLQDTINEFVACNGDTSVAFIDFKDADPNDKFEVNIIHNLKWAKATLLGDSTSRKIMVRYLAPTIPATGIPNAFTIEILDNACPLRGRSVKTYGIIGGGSKFTDSSYIIDSKGCMVANFKAGNRLSGSNFEYTWMLSSKDKTIIQTKDSIGFLALDTGSINARLWVTSKTHCNYFSYTDSVYIAPADAFKVDVSKDTSVCNGNAVSIISTPIFGAAPFHYKWTGGDTTPVKVISVTPQGVSKYFITLTNDAGCSTSDSVTITNYQPTIQIIADTLVCKNDTFSITAVISGDVDLKNFGWVGYPANQGVLNEQLLTSKVYTINVDDGGCTSSKSIEIHVSDPQINFTHNPGVCVGDSMVLTANVSGGITPYTINWPLYSLTGTKVYISTKNAATGYSHFVADVTDAAGCQNTNSDSINIYPLPTINITPITPVCNNSAPFTLDISANPAGGTWTGTAISNTFFNPSVSGVGVFTAYYAYTDGHGCSNNDSASITVYQQPVAHFTVDSTEALLTHSFQFTNTSVFSTNDRFNWNFGDPNSGTNNTSTDTDPTHTFSDTGWYTIKLTIPKNHCTPDSVVKTNYIHVYLPIIGPNAVNAIASQLLKIYPNPATDNLFIEISGKTITSIVITDVSGKEINSYKLMDNNSVSLAGTAKGLYLISVTTTENITYKSKFIVE